MLLTAGPLLDEVRRIFAHAGKERVLRFGVVDGLDDEGGLRVKVRNLLQHEVEAGILTHGHQALMYGILYGHEDVVDSGCAVGLIVGVHADGVRKPDGSDRKEMRYDALVDERECASISSENLGQSTKRSC